MKRLLNINHFVLFQLNAHKILNTHIYHPSSPTVFAVCYTIFRETVALLAQKLYAFCNVAINVQYTFFKFTMLLQCLKPYVFRPSVSSSSFYWASVANAPNVLQPYWLIVY